MNINFFILAIIIVFLFIAIRTIVKSKLKGHRCLGCSCGDSCNCGGNKKKIERG